MPEVSAHFVANAGTTGRSRRRSKREELRTMSRKLHARVTLGICGFRHQSLADGTGRIIASRSSVLMRIVLPQR